MICLEKSKTELKGYFEYELASVPPSLFDSMLLRKETKSSMVNAFQSQEGNLDLPSNTHFVLDGGNLLHCVVWPKPATFGQILDLHTTHVESHYGKDCAVVFDGYPDTETTKRAEQERRAETKTSRDILFDSNTPTTTSQGDFLANRKKQKNPYC